MLEIQKILSDLRRNVKDRNVECEGRHQVKAMLTNTLTKCDYYINKQRLKIEIEDNTEPINQLPMPLNDIANQSLNNQTLDELKNLTALQEQDNSNQLDSSLLPNI